MTNGTYDSSQSYDFCPQRAVNGTEDCLYLGLYSRPWSPSQALRPVVVVFYGGGFIEGGGSFTLPPAGYPVLNVSSKNDFIFVYPNYRVNAFGFLPGKEVAGIPNRISMLVSSTSKSRCNRHTNTSSTSVATQRTSVSGVSPQAAAASRRKPSPTVARLPLLSSPRRWPRVPSGQRLTATMQQRRNRSTSLSPVLLAASEITP
jgi:hypothetical protein